MIAILEKSVHNIDFHQIVDFIEASHIRTISESSIRRNLKLNDEEGISSLPDAELFENLALMGYNILPNQRFTFQKVFTTLRVNSLSFLGRTVPLFESMLVTQSEGSAILTEPHHTPSPQEQQSLHYTPLSPSKPTTTTEPIPTATPTEIPTLRQYSRRATRIAQSKALSPAADEPASLLRDDSQGKAFPTVSSLDAGQNKENINKTFALPHESTPRVTSLDADEGNRGSAEPSRDDALIKGRNMEIREEVGVERSTELGSNNTKEMVNVLSSIEAANILTSGVAAVSVPSVAGVSTVGVPAVSGLFPTVSAIFTTASVVTPYSRRPREILAKDKARIHAEEELKMLIDGLDRSNEVTVKHLQEYEQSEAELTIGEKIELINDLVKYQDHHAKILKYQAQQSKPLSKKEQREFYMSVLRSHAGWKTKHFRGMTLEEIREKFIPLDEGSAKRMKTSEDVSEEDLKGMMQLVLVEEVYVEALQVKHHIIDWEIHSVGKNDYWKIIRLGGHTAVYQQASRDKENELWVELKRLFKPNSEDQLWTHNQNLMHDPLDWRLYDTCGVHHVFTKDHEIFRLVESDYLLRKGTSIVMISNKIQVENYSQMANDFILKIYNIANSPR
uniref:Uncharacterized protein n=1 Tax=Tanacetum cinerariifolium TaxID=118510 RepID=A0A699GGT7_TANCI|nr:hypothetical protein [Tanacetum cinerariifolium]